MWSREEALALEMQIVADMDRRCERQAALVARLREQGQDTTQAELLLLNFADMLRLAQDHMRRLMNQEEGRPL